MRNPAVIPIVVGREAAHTPIQLYIKVLKTFSLYGMFIVLNYCYRNSTCKASWLSWYHELYMSRHSILWYSTLHPHLIEFITDCIDWHASRVIIDTWEYEINILTIQPTPTYPIYHIIEPLIRSHIDIVILYDNFRVYTT